MADTIPNIAGFEIIRMLGKGGMGAVYEAVQLSLDRKVALKVMLPALTTIDESFASRFILEAKSTAKLRHPNIVTIYETGEADDRLFMAIEYIEGGSLADLIKEGQIPDERIIQIVTESAKALQAAHDKELIHRDIKPDNILIDLDGSVLVADFGIVKLLDGSPKITATMGTIGSPHFMSPEQIKGEELDGRSDLYSLGIVLFEMLEGEVPFTGDNHQAIQYKHLTAPLPPFTHNNQNLVRVAKKLLEKDKSERYSSANELISDLGSSSTSSGSAASMGTTPAPTPSTSPMKTTPPPSVPSPIATTPPAPATRPASSNDTKGRPLVLVAVSIAIVLVVGVLVWWWIDDQSREQGDLSLDSKRQVVDGAAVQSEPEAEKKADQKNPPFRSKLPTVETDSDDAIATYALTIEPNPADAQVRILNIEPRYTPGIKLEPGQYRISVSSPGYVAVTEWIELGKNDLTRRVNLAQALFALNLTAKPAGAQIEIKGRGLYKRGMKLPPGRYDVDVTALGYVSQTLSIEMKSEDIAQQVKLARDPSFNTSSVSQVYNPLDEVLNALVDDSNSVRDVGASRHTEAREPTAEQNKRKSIDFLTRNRSKRGIVELPSGVQYRVIEDGGGSRPGLESEVIVHYRSSTMNGLEFDSSFARGEPVSFKVNQVIKGWQEVLPLMKEGSKWQIFVPPELGYGIDGQGPVGPNEWMEFDIYLLGINE